MLILISVLVIIVLGFIAKVVWMGYIGSASESSRGLMTFFIKNTPSKNSDQPVSEWPVYADKKFGFSMKYPSDYIYTVDNEAENNVQTVVFSPKDKSRKMDGIVLRVMARGKSKDLNTWISTHLTAKDLTEIENAQNMVANAHNVKMMNLNNLESASFIQNIRISDAQADGTLVLLDQYVLALVHPQGKADENYRQMVGLVMKLK